MKPSLAVTKTELAMALRRLACALEAKLGRCDDSRVKRVLELEEAVRGEIYPGRLKANALKMLTLETLACDKSIGLTIIQRMRECVEAAKAAADYLAADPGQDISGDHLLPVGEEWHWLEGRPHCAMVAPPLADELNIAGAQFVMSLNGYGIRGNRYPIQFQGGDYEQREIENTLDRVSFNTHHVVVTSPRSHRPPHQSYALLMSVEAFRNDWFELCRYDIVAWSKPLAWVLSAFECSIEIALIPPTAP